MQKQMTCTVLGRVQMVMYRDFTKRRARSLGLTGWVKNNDDGTVRIVAEGEESKLKALLSEIQKGSLLARVDDIRVSWKEPSGSFSSFSIVY
jgi:acylphosphatase